MRNNAKNHSSILLLYTSVIRKDHLVKNMNAYFSALRAIPLRSYSSNYHPENYSAIIIEHDQHKQAIDVVLGILDNLSKLSSHSKKVILTNSDRPNQIKQFYEYGAHLCIHSLSDFIPHLLGYLNYKLSPILQETMEASSSHILWEYQSQEMQETKNLCDKLAKNKIPVLISGPTGTGKNSLANYIHRTGHHSNGKIITIDCATLNENLFESEMYGHVKGAFTGAVMDQTGKLEMADNGTLILDGIENLSPKLQAKIAGMLDSSVFSPVGSNRKIKSDFRLISILNRSSNSTPALDSSLMYRLAGVRINLKPLHQIPEAIPIYFSKIAGKFHLKIAPEMSTQINSILVQYHWPGNLKEMENLCAKLSIFGDVVKPDLLHLHLQFQHKTTETIVPGLFQPLSKIIGSYVRFVYFESGRNITKTAERLKISRATVAKYLKGMTDEKP